MRINEEMLQARNQNRSTVVSQHGVVCSSQPLAGAAGLEVLRNGGNAIDAAVCVNAVLSVVEPMNCGPGGDLFGIVWVEKDRKLFGLNASGRSPHGWGLEGAQSLGLSSIPAYDPLAWSVPGCVSGWQALLDRFGTRKLAETLQPAIGYARNGFPVSPIIAQDWPFEADRFPTLAEVYMPEGRAPRFGEVFRNPALAGFLELLAAGGAEVFYRGEVAERIVRFSQAHGGRFTLQDFQEHEPTWVDPVSTTYRGFEVWELPPNCQGIAVLQMLNILEQFDIARLEPNSARHLHLVIEAKKLAFEDRAAYYADMDFADVPVEKLISKEYGAQRAARIDPHHAVQTVSPGLVSGESDTIYLATADDEGNMVSLIQSTYHGWGSHIVPDGLGFPIQNRGMSFALDLTHPNRLEPHKRPFHTIIPGFVTKEGRPTLAFGVMGGDFQPQGHVQVLLNLLDFGMSPQQAGDQPRVAHFDSSSPMGQRMIDGGSVGFERGFSESVKRELAAMGHTLRQGVDSFGGYQAIWREENPRRYFGASDPRKDGSAIGF